MNRRIWISVANFVAIALALVILVEYPQYANDAFYVLVVWMIVGFVLLYASRPRFSPTGMDPGASTTPFPSTTPLPSASAASAPPVGGGIGFCIYCANPIPPGTRACPSCGHALPPW